MSYMKTHPVPKTMPKRERAELVLALERIRDIATMETAALDPEIKEITRLWRESWIIEPLERLIERYRGE